MWSEMVFGELIVSLDTGTYEKTYSIQVYGKLICPKYPNIYWYTIIYWFLVSGILPMSSEKAMVAIYPCCSLPRGVWKQRRKCRRWRTPYGSKPWYPNGSLGYSWWMDGYSLLLFPNVVIIGFDSSPHKEIQHIHIMIILPWNKQIL